MLVVYCDRCEAKMGPAPVPERKFKVPVFIDREERLRETFEAHLCVTCARELLRVLAGWWSRVADLEKEWNQASGPPRVLSQGKAT